MCRKELTQRSIYDMVRFEYLPALKWAARHLANFKTVRSASFKVDHLAYLEANYLTCFYYNSIIQAKTMIVQAYICTCIIYYKCSPFDNNIK